MPKPLGDREWEYCVWAGWEMERECGFRWDGPCGFEWDERVPVTDVERGNVDVDAGVGAEGPGPDGAVLGALEDDVDRVGPIAGELSAPVDSEAASLPPKRARLEGCGILRIGAAIC
jgi:hypothetical protein